MLQSNRQTEVFTGTHFFNAMCILIYSHSLGSASRVDGFSWISRGFLIVAGHSTIVIETVLYKDYLYLPQICLQTFKLFLQSTSGLEREKNSINFKLNEILAPLSQTKFALSLQSAFHTWHHNFQECMVCFCIKKTLRNNLPSDTL